MSNIAISGDGLNMFVAAEDGNTGEQVILIKSYDTSIWSEVLRAPGTAANVLAWPGYPDTMLFYGNFDTDIQIYYYDISSDLLTDISPASLGAAVFNTLVVNPGRNQQLVAGLDGAIKFYLSTDNGATWSTEDLSLTGTIDALHADWGGDYWANGFLYAKTVAGVTGLVYTPNEFNSDISLIGVIPTDDTITKIEGV